MEGESELPSQTLYINNINEKIKKDVLKKTLYMVFAQYGKIMEIVACKGMKLRGQAWVVFHDLAAATNAMRSKQGFNFFDKPLKIRFSKNKSDKVAAKEGTPVPKREPKTTSSSKKRTRVAGDEDDSEVEVVSKKVSAAPALTVCHIPNRILFAQNLPDEFSTDETLRTLFVNYPGFMEVRLVPSTAATATAVAKRAVAFIEFQDIIPAGMALQQLHGMQLTSVTGETLHLTYAKQ